MASKEVRREFDRRYYNRFYRDPATRAATVHDAARHGHFLASYLKFLGLPVTRILDLGCGLGRLLRVMQRQYPRARCVGVDVSAYLCERHGWTLGSVVDYQASTPFDLVICHDVIQYLDDQQAGRAIENLARLSRGAVCLGVVTREDWRQNCDRERSDGEVHLRSDRWYRRRLARRFVNVGGGLYLKKPLPVTVWSLHRPG